MTMLVGASLAASATAGSPAAPVRAVFTSTNDAAGNSVMMYSRASDGSLSLVGEFDTGGTGTGGGLGNQGAIALTQDKRWLLVVNAGSNDISVFRVRRGGLTLTDVEPSNGTLPVSVTVMGSLVYVLNADGPGEITGFILDDGDLFPIKLSTRSLSGEPVTEPAQVEFSPDGEALVVTEKATNLIDTFLVGDEGLVGTAMPMPSSGETPFGFGFTRHATLIVSEAFGGAPDASAVSSYDVSQDGDLDVISPSLPTTETAACWIAITHNGRFTYTTNTGSGTVTGYRIRNDGSLTILDTDGVTAETGPGSAPTDLALSRNSRFLYVLNSATGEIDIFKVSKSNGRLIPRGSVSGLPANSTGLVAR